MSTIKSSDEHLTLNADGSSKDIKLQSNASEKVIVKSDGKVGIGTSSPARTFHVNSADANIASFEGHQGEGVVISSGTNGQVDIIGYDDGASSYNPIHIRSGTNGIFLDTTGAVTMPSQPAFQLIRTTNVSNVTGNGTSYTVVFNNEEFDQNADCSTTTFTAPVTGKYQFSFAIIFVSLSSATDVFVDLSTSNGSYRWNPAGNNPTVTGNTSYPSISGSILADLDASDTAVLEVTVNGVGGDTVDIYGSPTSGTYFSGHLAC